MKTLMPMVRGSAIAVLMVVALTGCGSAKGAADKRPATTTTIAVESTTSIPEPSTTTTSTTTTTTRPTTTTKPGPDGTRERPLAIGTSGHIEDYTVTVKAFVPDAIAQIKAANEFNDKSKNGLYGLITLDVTYSGSGEGSPGFDVKTVLIGTDARQYSTTDCSAVLPNQLSDAPTLEHGGKASGTVCVDYPPGVAAHALLFVDNSSDFDDSGRSYSRLP